MVTRWMAVRAASEWSDKLCTGKRQHWHGRYFDGGGSTSTSLFTNMIDFSVIIGMFLIQYSIRPILIRQIFSKSNFLFSKADVSKCPNGTYTYRPMHHHAKLGAWRLGLLWTQKKVYPMSTTNVKRRLIMWLSISCYHCCRMSHACSVL